MSIIFVTTKSEVTFNEVLHISKILSTATIKLIINNKINKIFVTHKDRLLRFGTELIISICKEFNTEVIIINNKLLTFEQELSQDVLEIIIVFSAKLYGSRSHKNMKKQI